ncbi:sigma-54-dependent transcriptional regulator [Algoriphagus mannitolivorans]|uniref:sigma-54-dependent transcriptional regulator n=1 Tax=Algoriphagus mannitolivorans TaxID=226504 RepID=UPI0003FF57EA|nr:sigma-54 dependent transcriptional regulator [Algoriphagus mannitolivorans]
MNQQILVIDDDQDLCRVLSNFLKKSNFEVDVAYKADDGLKLLREKSYDLILCDYRLPDMTGVEALQKIKVLSPESAVIIITGYSDVRTAVDTFKYGANDYVTKPLYPDELLVTVKETIQKNQEKNQQKTGQSPSNPKGNAKAQELSPKFIPGSSQASKKVQQHIDLIGPTDMSVLIIGETGTGKEFVSNSIHLKSSRAGKPFIAIDCGALPKELAGSELFGHVKGSFTGAIADKVGSFELANGGTIFLDEIGNLSYENQVKLLRVIQERKIKRIGGQRDIPIDVRIIAATNENLIDAIKEGKFREDLYHRINEFKINLLPIRERKDDILSFSQHFLELANQSLNKDVKGFSDQVLHHFMNYQWYGNLRELNNVVKRAVLLTQGDLVQPDALPEEITQPRVQVQQENSSSEDSHSLKSASGEAERQAIMNALEATRFNKSKAADLLNIDRKTLYNKLKLYNIQNY